jgi:two-component system sensor kinase FixL
VIQFFLKAGRPVILAVVAGIVALIAVADWSVGTRASLGVLYILPMVLAAIVLSSGEIVLLALVCSVLRSLFDIPSPRIESFLRFIFATLAYTGAGLFVVTVGGIRREQELRRGAEERLNTLVASSPAAILTLDAAGVVLAANKAADELFMLPASGPLRGRSVSGYLPVLSDALLVDPGPEGLRTAAQCQGRRENGEIFLAQTWFSSYSTAEGTRLAAIVVDASEEMRDREEQSLRQLMRGNRIAAAAVSHEVRNLCGAISVVTSNLKQKHARVGGKDDEDLEALTSLAQALETVAAAGLQSRVRETLEAVALRSVLDDLRIVIEPDWREIDGALRWYLPDVIPRVLAERRGLLQAFMNLAQNSHRAVLEGTARELSISVSASERTAMIRFEDTGPGIVSPERLFEPFQPGADGTGLGLYVSRAVVRSYGGDLRFEPRSAGSCFAVELQVVA